MDYSSDIIQLLGFILVLGGVALILVRATLAVAHGNRQRIRLGAEMVVAFSVIYWFVRPALTFIGLDGSLIQAANAIAFLWVISLAFLINSVMNQLLWTGLLSDQGERRVPKLITDGVGLLVYSIAIMLVLHYVYDEPIGAVLATSGAAAVVIGFGAQSTVREVFSGIALNATQALRVGDYVEIDGVYGQVYDINWRSVSLKSPNMDSLYIFPNSVVAEQTILNFSEPTDRFRYFVKFSVELSAPPALVIQSIAKELENSRYVFRDPKPNFNMLGYSEHGVDYRVRYHFDGDDPWWDAQNEVVMAIWSAMRKQGLRISMNRMLQGAPDEWPAIDERVKARTKVEDVKAVVKSHPIFGVLSEDEIDVLCKSYNTVDISPPACFYNSGDQSDGVFLILEGEVGVFDITDCDNELNIDTYIAGDAFGFAAAVNNTNHRFTAQATQYSITVRFQKEAIEAVLSSNSKLKSLVQELIEQQKTDRDVARDTAMKEMLLAQHQKRRHHLREDLRKGVDDLLQKPTLHHLLDHFSNSVRNEELAEGITAGAAMIATARGIPDDAEREYLADAISHADMGRHLDADHCMMLFEKYSDMLIDGKKGDEDRVMCALQEAKRVTGGAKVVIAICTGLCGVHDLPTKEELMVLETITKALEE